MHNALKNGFPPLLNEQSLKAAIASVCAEFGNVTSLTILPAAKSVGLQCTCILKLESPEAQAKLKSKLDVIDFGADILFFVEVDDNWTGPRS